VEVKTMTLMRKAFALGTACVPMVFALALIGTSTARDAKAGPFSNWAWRHGRTQCGCPTAESAPVDEVGGTWYWMRSPEDEKHAVMGLYNRYCMRCHQSDGRGNWDIPDVPDFTNVRWQASRSDAQLARIILEGRGAVMPPFRGTLTLEESWAMSRYLRTFVPGSEVSRPELGKP
jgi:hypothetical protein